MLGKLWRRTYLSNDLGIRLVAQQHLFVLMLSVAAVVIVGSRPEVLQSVFIWIGLGTLVAATLSTHIGAKRGQLQWARGCLPLLDLVSLGCVQLAALPDAVTLSLLAFFPAIWLVIELRRKGVLIAAVGTFVAIAVPTVVTADHLEVLTFLRSVFVPLIVIMVSLLVLGLYERLMASNKRAGEASKHYLISRNEERRMARLLAGVGESLSVGVLVIDTAGNDLMNNRAQREIHSLVSPSTNRDPTEAGHLVFSPDGTTPVAAESRPARRAIQGESFDNQILMAGPPGRGQRALSVSARQVFDDEGRHEGSVVVFSDITELQSAVRARDEVIATVSHELRTPLTSILGYADLASEELGSDSTAPAEPLTSYVSTIGRNAEQLLSLVEDLLVEQQARSGKLTLDRQYTDPAGLAADAVRSIRPQAARKHITIIDRALPTSPVYADATRLGQVLDNLLANAVKYTQSGGEVEVTTSQTPAGVEICVSDNGPGMDGEDASQLFTPFFRSRNAKTLPTSGSGLGLTIAKSITEAHGGDLSFETALGQGTTFRVGLPGPDQRGGK